LVRAIKKNNVGRRGKSKRQWGLSEPKVKGGRKEGHRGHMMDKRYFIQKRLGMKMATV